MENPAWLKSREEISKILKIPERIIDLVAVRNTLLGCVSGLSNSTIAHYEQTNEEYITKDLYAFLGFKGWLKDLDLNPWVIYKRVKGSKDAYTFEVKHLTVLMDDDIINLTYKLCRIFESIGKEIDTYYD